MGCATTKHKHETIVHLFHTLSSPEGGRVGGRSEMGEGGVAGGR